MKRVEPVRNERILNELYRIDPAWAEATLNAEDDIHLPTRLLGACAFLKPLVIFVASA